MCTELDEVTLCVPVGRTISPRPILHNDLDNVTLLIAHATVEAQLGKFRS